MLNGRADAEDAVQAAAEHAWKAPVKGHRIVSGRAWFLAIVANECRAIRRRRWWSVLTPGEVRATAASQASEAIEVREALARLEYHERPVMVLHYYLDMPYAEMAEVLGAAEASLRKRASRARQGLAHLMAAAEDRHD